MGQGKTLQPVSLRTEVVDQRCIGLLVGHHEDPGRVERFQIMAGGAELGKGFSELNDPIDQRKRFKEQMELREAGDKEAQRMDEDYLEALEYGMPPTAGFGMSERLFAFIMDKSVRETTLFPMMKDK